MLFEAAHGHFDDTVSNASPARAAKVYSLPLQRAIHATRLDTTMGTFLIDKAQRGEERALDQVCLNSVPLLRYLARATKNYLTYDEKFEVGLIEMPGIVERYLPREKVPISERIVDRVGGAYIDEMRRTGPYPRRLTTKFKKVSNIEDHQEFKEAVEELAKEVSPIAGFVVTPGRVLSPSVSLELIGEANKPFTSVSLDVHQEVMDKIDQEAVMQKIKQLPQREREVLVLSSGLFGMPKVTMKKLGEKYGISQSAISLTRKRAIKRLLAQE
jgi:RNA polymerase sigma factor (sigma-70 family)